MRPIHFRYALWGLLLGFVLSRIGFSDYDEVSAMFLLEDARLILVFAGGVALSALAFVVFSRDKAAPRRPLHKGTAIGAILFGVGWAVTSACPGIVLVQIGEGQLPALITLAGVCVGMAVYPLVHSRWFHWDAGSCGE